MLYTMYGGERSFGLQARPRREALDSSRGGRVVVPGRGSLEHALHQMNCESHYCTSLPRVQSSFSVWCMRRSPIEHGQWKPCTWQHTTEAWQ